MARLHKCLKTVLEMLSDRKYTIPEDMHTDIDSFIELYQNFEENPRETRKSMFFTVQKGSVELGVYWYETIKNPDIQEIIMDMESKELKRSIVVHNSKVTPLATNAIKNLRVQKIFIEIFEEAELQFNVTRHELVPKHIICSLETKKTVFEKYNVNASQLPKISSLDPPVKYLGAVKGQLIKIIRPNETMPFVEIVNKDGEKETKQLYEISYRIVV